MRIQSRLALLMVGLPTAGAGMALYDAFVHGVRPMQVTLFAAFLTFTLVGIEGGFHRYFSHKCCSATRPGAYILGIAGSMAGQGPVVYWASTHLVHHQYSDRHGDPHSPRVGASGGVRRLMHAHMGWLFAGERVDWQRHVPDLLRRRDVVHINDHYFAWLLLGLALPMAIAGVWEGSWDAAWRGLLWGGFLRIFVLHHLTWAVNSLAHTFGTRPFSTPDNSRNLALLALPTGGGSWHNNHHAFPAMARNDHHWWQIDWVGYVLEVMAFVGLLSRLKRPTRFRKGRRPGEV